MPLGGLFVFALVWVNVWVADRNAPRALSFEAEDDFVRAYKTVTRRHQALLRTAVAAAVALVGGVGFYQHWQEWMMFLQGGSFGIKDPQFGIDIGFYVFKLPFLITLLNGVMLSIVVAGVVAGAAHYAQGAIPIGRPHARITSAVKMHVSVLAGILALLQAVKYFLSRYNLNYSTRGVTEGANYTDVKLVSPALVLLSLISLLAAVVFFANMRRKGLVDSDHYRGSMGCCFALSRRSCSRRCAEVRCRAGRV